MPQRQVTNAPVTQCAGTRNAGCVLGELDDTSCPFLSASKAPKLPCVPAKCNGMNDFWSRTLSLGMGWNYMLLHMFWKIWKIAARTRGANEVAAWSQTKYRSSLGPICLCLCLCLAIICRKESLLYSVLSTPYDCYLVYLYTNERYSNLREVEVE